MQYLLPICFFYWLWIIFTVFTSYVNYLLALFNISLTLVTSDALISRGTSTVTTNSITTLCMNTVTLQGTVGTIPTCITLRFTQVSSPTFRTLTCSWDWVTVTSISTQTMQRAANAIKTTRACFIVHQKQQCITFYLVTTIYYMLSGNKNLIHFIVTTIYNSLPG